MNAYYVFAKANSDTDGSGSFPANPYDMDIPTLDKVAPFQARVDATQTLR